MQLKMDRVLLPDADGGAIGVWREGDDFCARITLDALAEFHAAARAEHYGDTEDGRKH